MRNAFFNAVFALAREDERIVLMVGDLGFRIVEGFMAERPKQFLNAGIAEQNMMSMAAGMALEGKIVFAYSIANFPTLRCLEQVRNDVCYHGARVAIFCSGGGFTYGSMGVTHHVTEDLAVTRAMPGLTVIAPGDPIEAACVPAVIVAHDGPFYVRLGKAGEPNIHAGPIDFQRGRAITVREGDDVSLIATGSMLLVATRAADRLKADGINARVLSMHTVKPLDLDAVEAAAAQTGVILTIEEHSVIGGLGAAVAEYLAERPGAGPRFKRLGVPSAFASEIGSQDHLLAHFGLTEAGVAQTAKQMLAS
ncbi:MAG: transketolase [Rhodospirillales bacterium]|nr:transketolase [Rhodospirillales bacterium]